MAPHSSTLAWKIPWTEEPGGYSPGGCKESDTTERLHFGFHFFTIGPSNSTPGYTSERQTKNTNSKRCMYLNVHSGIIYNCQPMKTTQVSINRWMDRENVVYIYTMEHHSTKKKWNFVICSNMNSLAGYYDKWYKSNK